MVQHLLQLQLLLVVEVVRLQEIVLVRQVYQEVLQVVVEVVPVEVQQEVVHNRLQEQQTQVVAVVEDQVVDHHLVMMDKLVVQEL